MISLETVLSEEEPVEKSRLLFAGKGSSFYLDENMRHKVCAQSREQLTELQRVIARMEDQQQTYEKDMESVSSFLLVYDSKKEENRQALRGKPEERAGASGETEVDQRPDTAVGWAAVQGCCKY